MNETSTTEIYTLSLHDALPIYRGPVDEEEPEEFGAQFGGEQGERRLNIHLDPADIAGVYANFANISFSRYEDRKSTRLNSSHPSISYAVFCLKKKKQKQHSKTS